MVRPLTVLIADDDKVTLGVIEDTVAGAGYEVLTATDGDEAWRKLMVSNASIAILDWLMPGLEGVEICRRARTERRLANNYFILLTGKTATEDLVQGLESGAHDFLRKPFDREELIARIDVGVRFVELQRKLAQRVEELEQAVAQVKRLEGLLPICSYCKRIRNETDSWERVDDYIEQHANVRFTHNICPDCYAKHVTTG